MQESYNKNHQINTEQRNGQHERLGNVFSHFDGVNLFSTKNSPLKKAQVLNRSMFQRPHLEVNIWQLASGSCSGVNVINIPPGLNKLHYMGKSYQDTLNG